MNAGFHIGKSFLVHFDVRLCPLRKYSKLCSNRVSERPLRRNNLEYDCLLSASWIAGFGLSCFALVLSYIFSAHQNAVLCKTISLMDEDMTCDLKLFYVNDNKLFYSTLHLEIILLTVFFKAYWAVGSFFFHIFI